jgi:hypothetical protein
MGALPGISSVEAVSGAYFVRSVCGFAPFV